MNDQPQRKAEYSRHRMQLSRGSRRRRTYLDTTVTDTWPPRLNTKL
jgi:hypothetical protein